VSSVKARDRAFTKVIGREYETFLDKDEAPRIEVRRYHGRPANNGPECDVWVTSGMSDVEMIDDDEQAIRRELIFYAPSGGDFARAMTSVARFPFEHGTFLDQGHSIRSYGAFFQPGGAETLISENAERLTLPHVLLLWPLLRHHQRLGEELEIDGSPVEFLWIVPISQAELELKNDNDTDALLDVFEENRHPWLFDPTRKSYV
jgi:hypothetical protein